MSRERVRVLVTGASGFIGARVALAFAERGDRVVGAFHTRPFSLAGVEARPLELRDPASVHALVADCTPHVIVHLAAMARTDECASAPAQALEVNVQGVETLIDAARDARSHLLLASTDLVFDGERAPYADDAHTDPLGVYGQSKALAEQRMIYADGIDGTIVRLSLTYGFGLSHGRSFAQGWLERLRRGERVAAFVDECRSVVYVDDVANAFVDLAHGRCGGIFHVGGPATVSRYAFGRALCEAFGLDGALVVPARAVEACLPEPRPRDVGLDITRTRAEIPFAPRNLAEGTAAMALAEAASPTT